MPFNNSIITKQFNQSQASTSIDDSNHFAIPAPTASLCTATNYTETDLETVANDKLADYNLSVYSSLTLGPETEEPEPLKQQIQAEDTTSLSLDHAGPSTSADQSKESDEPNLIKNKVGKRKSKKKNQYIDYISDLEDFSTFYGDVDDSDNWSEGQEVESEDSLQSERKTKKNKRCTKKNTKKSQQVEEDIHDEVVGESANKTKKNNSRKKRSENRTSGVEYVTKKGVVVPAKTILANPCCGKKCGNDCGSVTEERRESLFNFFWRLDKVRRRDWLVSLSQKENVKRKRSDSDKRNYTFKYFINEGEGRRYVCQQFLAATLNISDKTIYSIVKNATWGCAKEDMRGKCEPPNKTKESTLDAVKKFIKNLPAVPSHYCRQDSSKVYLSQEFKNMSNLYNLYKKHYVEQGIDVVSERIFRKIFQENFNIGFHVPKKDKCLKCLQFEKNDNPEKQKEKQDHEIEKEESYARFKVHKNIHKDDPSTLCASFDLEKVLNTPYAQSMLLYYSRKLAVYNLCFYENGTRNVFCFYWDESNGKRGANEVASILHKYIQSVDARGNITRLLLYCDCCPGQNRNRTVLAMLHSSLQECKNINTIQINFLLTGHTYMPVDSVHAIIENKLKNTTVYAPSQWFTVFATARQNPSPFAVERLSYEDFYRWDSISDKYFKGNLTGKISKVRVMTFKKDKQVVKYKTSMNAIAPSFDIEVQSKTKVSSLLPCYRSQLPIAKAKYDDLVKLCTDKVIPNCFKHEFVNIPRATNVKDCLPESDVEDSELHG